MGLLKLSKKKLIDFDPIEKARGLISKLSTQVKIEEAYLFGSGVNGKMTPDSDLDILVVFSDQPKVKLAYGVVSKPYFSDIAVDWIFKTKKDFQGRKEIGGVCFEAFHHGVKLT